MVIIKPLQYDFNKTDFRTAPSKSMHAYTAQSLFMHLIQQYGTYSVL